MEPKDRCHAHNQKHSGSIFRLLSVVNQSKQQTQIQQQNHHYSYKSQFLRHRGENEIGVPHGHEAQLILAAFSESLAPKAAGANGNFRLENLVAGTAGTIFGMEECLNSLLLVRL